MIFNQVQGGKMAVKTITVSKGNELPENAKDGIIAVMSDVKAKTVYVQNTEPTGPENGDVWMTVAEVSIAPIQINAITLYPSSFSQYISGEWVPTFAYIRANGEWISLLLWLFRWGDECVTATGGWYREDNVSTEGEVTVRDGEPLTLTVRKSDDYAATSHLTTNESIPFGLYSTLRVTCRKTYAGAMILALVIYDSDGQYYTDLTMDISNCRGDDYQTFELDLTSLDQSYSAHLGISLSAVGGSNSGTTETAYFGEIMLVS